MMFAFSETEELTFFCSEARVSPCSDLAASASTAAVVACTAVVARLRCTCCCSLEVTRPEALSTTMLAVAW